MGSLVVLYIIQFSLLYFYLESDQRLDRLATYHSLPRLFAKPYFIYDLFFCCQKDTTGIPVALEDSTVLQQMLPVENVET